MNLQTWAKWVTEINELLGGAEVKLSPGPFGGMTIGMPGTLLRYRVQPLLGEDQMIVIKITYHPPIGSGEDTISIDKQIETQKIRKFDGRLVEHVAGDLFQVLVGNSEELRKELDHE